MIVDNLCKAFEIIGEYQVNGINFYGSTSTAGPDGISFTISGDDIERQRGLKGYPVTIGGGTGFFYKSFLRFTWEEFTDLETLKSVLEQNAKGSIERHIPNWEIEKPFETQHRVDRALSDDLTPEQTQQLMEAFMDDEKPMPEFIGWKTI